MVKRVLRCLPAAPGRPSPSTPASAALALLALMGVGLVACATHPAPTPPPPPVVAAPSPPPAAAPVAAAATSQEPVINAKLLHQGYRAKVTNGQVLYCRSEPITGSQFKTTTCLTEDQLLTRERNTDTFKDNMGRDFGNTCAGPQCR